MDNLEKVERLRANANVSYEEAKAALEQANGDLLDAMVILEKAGKTRAPQQNTYSTSYEEQKQYLSVQEQVDGQKAPSFGETVKGIFRVAGDFIFHTDFRVLRNDKLIFAMPTWVLALIVLFGWQGVIPVMLIAMLFRVRYRFDGERHTGTANDFLDKAGHLADDLESEITRKTDGQ